MLQLSSIFFNEMLELLIELLSTYSTVIHSEKLKLESLS